MILSIVIAALLLAYLLWPFDLDTDEELLILDELDDLEED